MTSGEIPEGQGSAHTASSQALASPDAAAALRAEQNTRPETLDRVDKLKDKVSAVTSLEAAGRGNVFGTDRPLWTRHDRAGKPGAPLTSGAFAENLKEYARQAGLNHIQLHQTRHTFARIVAEETGSFLEAQEALDHVNHATTRVYVRRITVKKDRHGKSVAGGTRLTRAAGESDGRVT